MFGGMGSEGTLPPGETSMDLTVCVEYVLLRAQALPSNTYTTAAISHTLEKVASSRDMLSRVGRLVLIRCSQENPVLVV